MTHRAVASRRAPRLEEPAVAEPPPRPVQQRLRDRHAAPVRRRGEVARRHADPVGRRRGARRRGDGRRQRRRRRRRRGRRLQRRRERGQRARRQGGVGRGRHGGARRRRPGGRHGGHARGDAGDGGRGRRLAREAPALDAEGVRPRLQVRREARGDEVVVGRVVRPHVGHELRRSATTRSSGRRSRT